MSNLPTQRGQELNGFLAALREKNSIVAFMEPSEQTMLSELITEFDEAGSSPHWERRTHTFLRAIKARASNGLFDLTEAETRELDGLLSDRPVPPPQAKPARYVPPKRNWSLPAWKKPVAVAAAVLAFAIGVPVVHSMFDSPAAPPAVSQPLPPVNDQPLTRTDLQQTLELFGPWQTIAPSDARPDTAQPAVLMLKQDGATIASQRWSIPFDKSVWQQQDSPFIARESLEGTTVKLVSSTQQEFMTHVDQAFLFEQAPGQVYLVDDAGNVWYASLAQATSLRQSLPAK